jgi:hypothetical protein
MRIFPGLLAATALLLAAHPARAGQISWTLTSTVSTNDFVGDPLYGSLQETHGYHYVQSIGGAEPAGFFLGGVSGSVTDPTGTAAAMTLATFYDLTPDSFHYGATGAGGDFRLDLTLTNPATGGTGLVTFTGGVWGDVGPDNYHLDYNLTTARTQHVLIDGKLWDVTLGDPTGLSGATATDGGAFPVTVANSPEPATWALAAAGLLCAGLARWKRKVVSGQWSVVGGQ